MVNHPKILNDSNKEAFQSPSGSGGNPCIPHGNARAIANGKHFSKCCDWPPGSMGPFGGPAMSCHKPPLPPPTHMVTVHPWPMDLDTLDTGDISQDTCILEGIRTQCVCTRVGKAQQTPQQRAHLAAPYLAGVDATACIDVTHVLAATTAVNYQ